MNLLTLIQSFCKRTNVRVPNSVIGNDDEQIQQLLGLLEEEGDDLSQRNDWQELTLEALHTTLPQEDQGSIETIAPEFDRFKPNTFYDRSLRREVLVVNEIDWQHIKGAQSVEVLYQARLRGNKLLSTPQPPSGHVWAFEYISKNWITDLNGLNPSTEFLADTDLIKLPDDIILIGLRWRWKKEKGFDYDEDFQTYEGMIEKSTGSNGMTSQVDMSSREYVANPKIAFKAASLPIHNQAIVGRAIVGLAIVGRG